MDSNEAPDDLTGQEFVDYMNRQEREQKETEDSEELSPKKKHSGQKIIYPQQIPKRHLERREQNIKIREEARENEPGIVDNLFSVAGGKVRKFATAHPKLTKVIKKGKQIGKKTLNTVNKKVDRFITDEEAINRKQESLRKTKTSSGESFWDRNYEPIPLPGNTAISPAFLMNDFGGGEHTPSERRSSHPGSSLPAFSFGEPTEAKIPISHSGKKSKSSIKNQTPTIIIIGAKGQEKEKRATSWINAGGSMPRIGSGLLSSPPKKKQQNKRKK